MIAYRDQMTTKYIPDLKVRCVEKLRTNEQVPKSIVPTFVGLSEECLQPDPTVIEIPSLQNLED